VGDRWMGIGTALLRVPPGRAREAGVIRFTVTIHAENLVIRRLLEKVIGPHETNLAAGAGAGGGSTVSLR
jgi:hypothetical protein